VGWVGASAGFVVCERSTAPELADAFELSRLRRDPVVLSEEAIDALRRAR